MKRACKFFILLLMVTLCIITMFVIESVSAQSVPNPSVPEFTIALVDHSYDVPSITTSTINPYNNQTITKTVPGYHVENETIDLKIKNQPIPSTIDGNKSYLLFYVRLKGHYSDNWSYPYTAIDSYPVQTNSSYTIISFTKSVTTTTDYGSYTTNLHAGDEIDFQVKAIVAYGYNYSLNACFPCYSYDYDGVSASDWSNTKTFEMPEQITPSSTVPEFAIATILPLLIVIPLMAGVLVRKKRNR